MPTNSDHLDHAREKANLAFDRHCAQVELLWAKAAPTPEDVDSWLAVRVAFYDAQEEFEKKLFPISPE